MTARKPAITKVVKIPTSTDATKQRSAPITAELRVSWPPCANPYDVARAVFDVVKLTMDDLEDGDLLVLPVRRAS